MWPLNESKGSRYEMRRGWMKWWSVITWEHEIGFFFSISVLLLSFVQIRRIPHFSLFRVIYGCFSSWHHRRDLDVHHLLPPAHSEQDALENDTSGGTSTFHSITNAVEDAERKSMSQCELTAHTRPPGLRSGLSCVLSTSERARQTQKHWWFWAQAADLCTIIGWIVLHAQHLLQAHTNCLFHTQTQPLYSHYCQPDAAQSSVTCSSLISFFPPFVSLPSAPFSPPPLRRFQFWSSGWHWRRTSSKSVWTTRARSSSSSREERRRKYGGATQQSHQILKAKWSQHPSFKNIIQAVWFYSQKNSHALRKQFPPPHHWLQIYRVCLCC